MEIFKQKLNMITKSRLLTRQEILRDRLLKSDILNRGLIEGMIVQNNKLKSQMETILKSAILSLFFAFVALQGGAFKIPGTGATISEIPAFFEIAIVVCALNHMYIPFLFLSTQLYDGNIAVLIDSKSMDGVVDSDLLKSSMCSEWLFIKYANAQPSIGRQNIYENSKKGKVFNFFLVSMLLFTIIAAYLMLNISMIYLAYVGLADSFAHWSIFIFCLICFCLLYTSPSPRDRG